MCFWPVLTLFYKHQNEEINVWASRAFPKLYKIFYGFTLFLVHLYVNLIISILYIYIIFNIFSVIASLQRASRAFGKFTLAIVFTYSTAKCVPLPLPHNQFWIDASESYSIHSKCCKWIHQYLSKIYSQSGLQTPFKRPKPKSFRGRCPLDPHQEP